jgi:hypothetical protein
VFKEKPISLLDAQVSSDISANITLPITKKLLSKRKQSEIKSLQMGMHQSTSSTIGINIYISSQRMAPPHSSSKKVFQI